LADWIVIWRFKEVAYGLSRAEAEFLRDSLFAQPRDDWARLGVLLRRALNAPETELPVEFSAFDVPALRAVLDGVLIRSSGLAALQHDVGAKPHPDGASAASTAWRGGAKRSGDEAFAGEAAGVSSEPIVVWDFGGPTQGLNRHEAELLRDWLLAEPNLAWIALGRRVREALDGAEGQAPVELTLSDVHVVRAVLDAAPPVDDPGLASLKRAAALAW
jgi:hypothetical protein